jgi:hypothetical protein
MILRAVIAALVLTATLTACTVQRIPTDCIAAPSTTYRTKNRALNAVNTSDQAPGRPTC